MRLLVAEVTRKRIALVQKRMGMMVRLWRRIRTPD